MTRNPILPGFNPDPSICRVGDDYYIATSTFEWYPGVQIHHSRNLVDWELVSRPLDRADLLDMRGEPDSCGVWAPCLTFCDGLFHLAYTDVRRFDGNFKDTHNYLTTSPTIDGRWSERVYLNSSGFDPSLFHDDDGRKYVVNMIWDHRPDRSRFGGIVLQEYSPQQRRLIGPIRKIFTGSSLGLTEGPHLYRIGSWYYLLTAEGGTGYDHAVTLARSRELFGPYELHPQQHIATARDRPADRLQRVGHGDLVQIADSSYRLVHLCSRPLGSPARSPLGRETAIRTLELNDDGWFRLAPAELQPAAAPAAAASRHERNYVFDQATLPRDFQWLRSPQPETLFSLSERKARLQLFGRESLGSLFEQALVARRQTNFCFEAETALEFRPDNFQQAAGLVCYYNGHKYHYVYVSFDERIGTHIGIMSCEADQSLAATFPISDALIPVQAARALRLRARVRESQLLFAWSYEDSAWNTIPIILDAGILSDEAGKGESANFTGTFVGMCCQDLTGQRTAADFRYFSYRERDFGDPLEEHKDAAALLGKYSGSATLK